MPDHFTLTMMNMLWKEVMTTDNKKTVDVWVTRDTKDGNEPDLLMIHALKPELNERGDWASDTTCMVVPDLKNGRRKRMRLDIV